MPASDPLVAEAALAAIGIVPILKGEPSWNEEKRTRARMLPKDINAALNKYVSGATEKSGPLPDFDLDEVDGLLGAGLGEKQVTALAKAMGDDPLQASILASAQRLVQLANTKVPRPTRQTAVGMVPSKPGAKDVADFARWWSVAADPQIIFSDMLEGSLSPDMIAAFKASWPSLDALTQEMIPRVVAGMRAKRPAKDGKPGWELDSRRDQMLAVMMGRGASPAQQAVAQALQQLAAPMPASTSQPLRPQDMKTDLETPGQGGSDAQK